MSAKIPVCIDFDGVLNDYEGWRGPNYMYSPRPGAREFLETLKEKGYYIIIFSTRDIWRIRKWFKQCDLHYDKITNKKPPAIAYIDDRGLKFNGDFRQTLHELDHFKTHWELKEDIIMSEVIEKNRTFLVKSRFGTYPFNNRKTAEQLNDTLNQYEKDMQQYEEDIQSLKSITERFDKK